jgi:hypothetical protein
VIDSDIIAAELERQRSWFEQWRTPSEFAQRFEQLKRIVKSEFYFNRNESKWAREAWVLNEFAQITTPMQIKLNRDDPPDAYVRINSEPVPLEISEVIEPGRRRGLEYRPGTPQIEDDPIEDWIARADAIAPALRDRIADKKMGSYPAGTILLIYLNISEWGIRQREIESEIRSILVGPRGSFASVQVLWKEKLFSSTGEIRLDPRVSAFEDFRDND